MTPPLAYQMRPQTLAEVVGQQHLLGKNQILERMVNSGTLQSFILYGPPGTGKTSIAAAIAQQLHLTMTVLNAATVTKTALNKVLKSAAGTTAPQIIFIDEIHRLTTPNQDLLLKPLEKGQIVLIGATMENPGLTLTPALRSRVLLFQLQPLTSAEVEQALQHILQKLDRQTAIEPQALHYLAQHSQGDLRGTINALDLLLHSTPQTITIQDVKQVQLPANTDSQGDFHYNMISALQKSIRGSDVNAALYYLAKLVDSGDLNSLCRRLQVIAYEDIGLADMNVASHVYPALQAAQKLGWPEAQMPLADIVIELSLSPKSNAGYTSLKKARTETKNITAVNPNLVDTHYQGAPATHYLYPHDFGGWVPQQYLPDALKKQEFYDTKTLHRHGKIIDGLGHQKQLNEVYRKIQKLQNSSTS